MTKNRNNEMEPAEKHKKRNISQSVVVGNWAYQQNMSALL